jgi:hypothetical protein
MVLALVISVAGAAPRLDAASTGLVQTPTADILGEGMFDLAVSYTQGGDLEIYPARLVYGLGKAELGIAYITASGDDFQLWQYSGKVQLLPETSAQPAVAFGADYADFDVFGGDASRWSVYVVGTKQLTASADGPAVTGNLGAAYERWSEGGMSESNFVPFVGLEVGLGEATSIIGEYKWKQDDVDIEAIMSVGVRHAFSPDLLVEAGFTNLLGFDQDREFYAGLTYRWGRQ